MILLLKKILQLVLVEHIILTTTQELHTAAFLLLQFKGTEISTGLSIFTSTKPSLHQAKPHGTHPEITYTRSEL